MLDAMAVGPDLAVATWRSRFGGHYLAVAATDPGSYPAVLGRRGHLPNRRALAMAEAKLALKQRVKTASH